MKPRGQSRLARATRLADQACHLTGSWRECPNLWDQDTWAAIGGAWHRVAAGLALDGMPGGRWTLPAFARELGRQAKSLRKDIAAARPNTRRR